ncbi:MAG: helix-turn-helix domain-containing protein [Polyangia bacterium]|jgi:excisionase family DNA binding protein
MSATNNENSPSEPEQTTQGSDGDLTSWDKDFLQVLRGVVQEVVREMSTGPGGKTQEQLTRWTRLVGAVYAEIRKRGEIESAVRNVVYQDLSDVIGQHADRFFGARRTQEMSTLIVLVAKGDVYLGLKEAAKIASCSARTLYRALESGEIPKYWAGADPRIRLGDLHKYMARKREVEPNGAK